MICDTTGKRERKCSVIRWHNIQEYVVKTHRYKMTQNTVFLCEREYVSLWGGVSCPVPGVVWDLESFTFSGAIGWGWALVPSVLDQAPVDLGVLCWRLQAPRSPQAHPGLITLHPSDRASVMQHTHNTAVMAPQKPQTEPSFHYYAYPWVLLPYEHSVVAFVLFSQALNEQFNVFVQHWCRNECFQSSI